MKKSNKKNADITMEKAMNDPRNRGYHLIVSGKRLFKARTGQGASKILKEIHQKTPKQRVAITYLTDADSLILWL